MVMLKREEDEESKYMKGVRHLSESGISKVPSKYILPVPDRPQVVPITVKPKLEFPTIDLSKLRNPEGRSQVLQSLSTACQVFGFFQVVNHGISREALERMMETARRFFQLPEEDKAQYMSGDIRAPVRYGTSFNQLNDGVFCWRDFLKLNCHPLSSLVPFWPSSPMDLREVAASYAMKNKELFLVLMEGILETMGLGRESKTLEELEQGTHMMIINSYPPCPEPELTLGMPPHSDYGFLTILLQDDVKGLQVQCGADWVTVDPAPESFFVNVGDHLEMFSNGRYKSVLHRVIVNDSKARNSVASLHSLPFDNIVRPPSELINGDDHKRLYKDTDFASFLDYMSVNDAKHKSFLESRKLANNS